MLIPMAWNSPKVTAVNRAAASSNKPAMMRYSPLKRMKAMRFCISRCSKPAHAQPSTHHRNSGTWMRESCTESPIGAGSRLR